METRPDDAGGNSRRAFVIAAGTALIAIAGFIYWYLPQGADTARASRSARNAVPVTVATAQQKDMPVEIRAIGSVQPLQTVACRALVGGQLTRVWFREGEEVRRGQTLFTIDPRPMQAARRCHSALYLWPPR